MSGNEPNLRTPEDNGAGHRPEEKWGHRRTRFEDVMDVHDWQRQQDRDVFERETACRAALDRINLGLHTSSDVALLRRELGL